MTRFLRLIACLLVLAILTSIFTTTLFADETGENTENTDQAETNDTPAEGEEAPAEEPAEGEEATLIPNMEITPGHFVRCLYAEDLMKKEEL